MPATRRRLRLGVDRLQPHQTHRPPHALAVGRLAPAPLQPGRRRLVVGAGAGQAEQFASPPHARGRVALLDQAALALDARAVFLSHSNSISSRPICSDDSAGSGRSSALTGLPGSAKGDSTPSSSASFPLLMSVGWIWCWAASSLAVLSPLSAVRAIRASNAAV